VSVRRKILGSLFLVASVAGLNAQQALAVQVFPSGTTVPENLLRIELRFSEPLEPPLQADELRLIGAAGEAIEDAFLDLTLPSADDRSVIVLMHPGRVKSGVGANLALGRALHVGETVTLEVSHPSLAEPLRKTWRVTAFDPAMPLPAAWTFAPPARDSCSPLELHLGAPISASTKDLIAIRGPDGGRFPGEAQLEEGETVWRFTPRQPWLRGRYAVVVNLELEDPAGNRPGVPFETKGVIRIPQEADLERSFEPAD
jgi:hypothetical protein